MKATLLILVVAVLCVVPAFAETPKAGNYGQIPLYFEQNNGQMDSRIRFLSRGPGYGLFLAPDEAIIRLVGQKTATVRMKLVGGAGDAHIEGVGPTAGKTNYLTGARSSGWHTDIQTYSRVRYSGVYPGIDLTYYGNQRQLEYDFLIRPGSRPDSVKMRFDGVRKIEIDSDGGLVLKTSAGEIRQPKPVVYQEDGGRRVPVHAEYVLRDRRTVGFRVDAYDQNKALTIDPVLIYSSYFGGSITGTAVGDQANAISVDAGGNVYVTGQTSSTDLYIINAAQTTQHGGTDAFVFKLDPTGTILLYSTYFGGIGNDEGHAIAVDGAGNAYITGFTSSDNLPTTANALQKSRAGGQDAYLLKLNPVGNTMLYSSFLGGSADDRGLGVAVDNKGAIYVTGITGSANFPVAAAFQSTNAGGLNDVFVTKFGPTLAVQYSTFVGGRGNDQSYGIAVDPAGAAYVVGYTTSGCPPIPEGTPNAIPCDPTAGTFPRVNALQPSFGGGPDDAFIFKLNPSGSALEYSTYLGGEGSENATRVAVNADGYAFMTGYTSSSELTFPLLNPIQFVPIGGFEGFVTCLAPGGKSAVFSTYFGGEANDSGVGIALDAAGNIYVAGYTDSTLLQTVNAFQANNAGSRDGFMLKLDSSGQHIIYSTFIGGSGTDGIVGLAVDGPGNAYIAGFSYSVDLPVVYPIQPSNAGAQDAFIAKFNSADIVSSSEFTVSNQGGSVVATTASSLNPVFGYATADVPNGGAPTGLEILDLKSADVTVTEVGILAPRLTSIGRFFVEVDANTRSVLSLANPSDVEVTFDSFFTDSTGAPSNFFTQTIPPHQHFSAFVSDLPFGIPTNSSGTINFTASSPVAATAFRTFNNERGDFILSGTPVADPTVLTDQPVTISDIADGDGWDSSIILVNTTEDTMHGEIRFFNPAGQPMPIRIGGSDPTPVFEYEIPMRSFSKFQTNGTVSNTDPDTGEVTVEPLQAGTVQVVPFAGSFTPAAHAVVSWNVANITVFQTPIEAQLPAKTMRLYAETAGSTFDFANPEIGSLRTAVAVANPGAQEATVRFDLTGLDGTPTGLTTTVQIPAGGQYTNFIHQIPGFTNMPVPFRGVLKVTSVNVPGVTAIGLRTFFNERFQFLGTTTGPLIEDAGTSNQLVFPHIAEGGGYSTEFVLIARSNGQGSAGTLQFFTQQGLPLSVTKKPQ